MTPVAVYPSIAPVAEGQVRYAIRRVRVEEEEGALLGAQAGSSRKKRS